jgi:hypothetical protein
MRPVSKMTQGELAAYIDSHLSENGINVVLSGGASVAIYSDHKYVSRDLDFIAQFTIDHAKLESVMKELGFELSGKYYHHPQTPYFVEFISGPPSIGQDPIDDIHEVKMPTGNVRIISPTDCVKDRLAAFFYWGDQQGLEQAVLVSKSIAVDIDSVEAWSIREEKEAEFEEFIRRLGTR